MPVSQADQRSAIKDCLHVLGYRLDESQAIAPIKINKAALPSFFVKETFIIKHYFKSTMKFKYSLLSFLSHYPVKPGLTKLTQL